MGSNMNLDYAAMHSVASKIKSEEQPLSEFVSRMHSHVNELRGVWDSDAAQTFEATWNEIKPHLDKLHSELIPNIGKTIDTAADGYQAAEDNAKQMSSI